MAGVERLVQRRVLVEPGGVLEHDRVDDAPLGRRLDDLGAVPVVGREADELRLARLADRLGRLLEFLPLDEVDGVVERVVVAEAVDEEEVDVVGAQGLEPRGRASPACPSGPGIVLGDQDDLLADLGRLLEPLLEAGLGAVDLGGVEGADAAGVGQPEQPLEDAVAARAPVPISSMVISRPVLPSFRLGRTGVLAAASWASAPGAAPRAAAVASAPAWRNVRRSVPLVWSWDIALDSSMVDVRYEPALPDPRILARPADFRTVDSPGLGAGQVFG